VVVNDVDLDSAERTASRLESAKALRLDVTIPSLDAWSTAVVAEHGRLDVWFSNAAFQNATIH